MHKTWKLHKLTMKIQQSSKTTYFHSKDDNITVSNWVIFPERSESYLYAAKSRIWVLWAKQSHPWTVVMEIKHHLWWLLISLYVPPNLEVQVKILLKLLLMKNIWLYMYHVNCNPDTCWPISTLTCVKVNTLTKLWDFLIKTKRHIAHKIFV